MEIYSVPPVAVVIPEFENLGRLRGHPQVERRHQFVSFVMTLFSVRNTVLEVVEGLEQPSILAILGRDADFDRLLFLYCSFSRLELKGLSLINAIARGKS